MKRKITEEIFDVLKYSSIIMLLFIVINVVLSSILFLCHISITNCNIMLSIVFTVLAILLIYKNKDKYKILIASIIAVCIFIISIFISTYSYDLSWDGNTYHKLAIGMMKDGWNPIYQSAKSFIQEDSQNTGIFDDGRNSIWIEHYPKASWIFAANIYSATNNIETAKVLNILMMYVCFGITLSYLSKKTNAIFSLIIAILIICTPVTIVQTLNFYIDGLLAICISIILCALVALSDKNNIKNKKEDFIILALTLILCINLKFTGLIYSAIFCFMFFVFWLYQAYKNNEFKKKFIRYIMFYIITVTISIGIVGFSPYIKNTITKHNPLYPLLGKDKIDIMTYNQPVSFSQKSSIEKFFISLFGVSENIKANSTNKEPSLKIPFTFNEQEVKEYNRTDLRISGFGVLFSGIFIISIIIIGLKMYKLWKDKNTEQFAIILTFLIVSAILVLITDGSWWARYVPYIYLIPILALCMASINTNKKWSFIGIVLAIIMFINIGLIANCTIEEYTKQYSSINKEIKIIKNINKKGITVKISPKDSGFASVIYGLRDKNIKFELVRNSKQLINKRYTNFYFYENKI